MERTRPFNFSRSASLASRARPYPVGAGRLPDCERPRLDAGELGAELAFRDFRVMCCLCAQPIAVREPEEPTEPQVGIRRDRPLTGDDVSHTLRWHADLLGETVLTDAERPQELL